MGKCDNLILDNRIFCSFCGAQLVDIQANSIVEDNSYEEREQALRDAAYIAAEYTSTGTAILKNY